LFLYRLHNALIDPANLIRPKVCHLALWRTDLPRKKYTPEKVVAKGQVEMLVPQGQNIADAIRQTGGSEVRNYRWRHEYGGLMTEQIKRARRSSSKRIPVFARAISDLRWTGSYCRMQPGKIFKPRGSPRVYLADQRSHACLRAPRLCGARAAPLDAAQGLAGQ